MDQVPFPLPQLASWSIGAVATAIPLLLLASLTGCDTMKRADGPGAPVLVQVEPPPRAAASRPPAPGSGIDGFADSLAGRLRQVDDIVVIEDMRAGREAPYILQASAELTRGRLFVRMVLQGPGDGRTLWQASYWRDPADSVQALREAADQAARQLLRLSGRPTPTPAEPQP